MRTLSVSSSVSALLLCAAGLTAQLPSFQAYHGVDSATHAAQTGSLTGLGYRPISLSVGGTRSAPHYAAVWAQRPGPNVLLVQDKTTAEVQAWLLNLRRSGYRPAKITVAGDGLSSVCAAVAIQENSLSSYARFDLSQAQLDTECAGARNTGYRMVDATVYGSGSAPRFAAVFEENPLAIAWEYEFGDFYLDLQEKLDAHEEENVRIAHITLSDSLRYLVLWQDDVILDADIERWDMTAAQYQAEFSARVASGYLPICVQAGGPSVLTRYAAVFTKSDLPAPRSMRKTGQAVPEFAHVDAAIEAYMRSNGIRATSIAIVKEGRLVYARAFTWAESNYPLTKLTSKFRTASLAKPITSILVHNLEDAGLLDVATTKLNSILGYTPADPRFQLINLQSAVMHTSGLAEDNDDWAVANWWNPGNPQLPINPLQMAQHGAEAISMIHSVGQYYDYSNIAYCMLGRVVERKVGSQYGFAMQTRLLNQVGIAPGRVHVGQSRKANLHPDEVYYHQRDLDLRPSNVNTARQLLAKQYSGNVSRLDATGGLVISPVDYARILCGVFQLGNDNLVLDRSTADRMLVKHVLPTPGGGTFQLSKGGFSWTDSGGVTTWRKGGQMNGVSPDSMFRSDEVTLVVMSNRTNTDLPRSTQDALVNSVSSWPAHDLWPSVNLVPFHRSPALNTVLTNNLPHVTNQAFQIQGERLSQIATVRFGSQNINSIDPADWATGYFTRISATRIDVHPPQGLPPATYQVTVTDAQQVTSNAIGVTLVSSPQPVVRAPLNPPAAFTVYATLDPALSVNTVALLAFSTSNTPTAFPYIVSFGLGNGGQSLGLWPTAVSFGRVGVASWPLPQLPRGLQVFFQVAQADLQAAQVFPLSTSDVTSVIRL